MSATVKPLTVEECLPWERAQKLRYEFDGIQPVAVTGGNRTHSRIQTRLIMALGTRVPYPDASVLCGGPEDDGDIIVRRRAEWAEETVVGLNAMLNLPETAVETPRAAIYG